MLLKLEARGSRYLYRSGKCETSCLFAQEKMVHWPGLGTIKQSANNRD